jgi:hypothetical protein
VGDNSLIDGRKLGIKLLNAMGVDSSCVESFTITFSVHDPIRLQVNRFVTSKMADGLENVLGTNIVAEHFCMKEEE